MALIKVKNSSWIQVLDHIEYNPDPFVFVPTGEDLDSVGDRSNRNSYSDEEEVPNNFIDPLTRVISPQE